MAVSSSRGICGDIAGLARLDDEGKEAGEEEEEGMVAAEEGE